MAPLAGDTSTGAAGALEGAMESTKAFNKLKAFTLPMPVAKSHPGAARVGRFIRRIRGRQDAERLRRQNSN